MKQLYLAVRVLILIIGLLLSILAYMLQHDDASRILIRYALDKLPELTVKQIQGNFLQGLHLTDLHYNKNDIDITLKKGDIRLNITSLLLMRIIVKDITANELTIKITNNSTEDRASLPEIKLPFAIGIQQLVLNKGLLEVDGWQWPIQRIDLAANMYEDQLFLHDVTLDSSDIYLTFNGDLRFNGAWPVNAVFEWKVTLPDTVAAVVNAKHANGTGLLSGSIEQLHIRETIHQPLQMQGDIHLQTRADPLYFSLQQQWQSALITLAGQQWQLTTGNIDISGHLDNYNGMIKTHAQLQPWPDLALTLFAKGNQQGLEISELKAVYSNNLPGNSKPSPTNKSKTNESTINVQGKLVWSPAFSWQLKGNAQHIDPALVLPEFPGALNFKLATEGKLNESLFVKIALDDISGLLRDSSISGYSHSQWHEGRNLTTDTHISIADNEIRLKGLYPEKTDEKLDLQLQVDGNRLNAVFPDVYGSISLNAKLTGSRNKPLLNADLNAGKLRYQGLSLDNLALTLGAEDSTVLTMQLDISGRDLEYDNQMLVSGFTLRGAGKGSSSVARVATLDNLAMQWQLQHVSINSELAGNWHLQKMAKITLEKQAMVAETICLRDDSESSRICMQAEGNTTDAEARLTFRHFPLSRLAGLLDKNILDINGELNATAEFELNNNIPSARVIIDGGKGYIAWLDEGQENYRITWHEAQLNATLIDEVLQGNWQWLFDNNDRLTGEVSGKTTGQFPLQGKLLVELANMQWLELLLPIQQVRGKVRGEVKMAGTMNAPVFTGNITFDDGYMHVIDAGVSLENIVIQATSTGNNVIELNGHLNSGSGQLHLSGNVDTKAPLPWPVNINLEGQNILAIDRSDAFVTVDPDVQLMIANQLVQFRGKVKVTEADLKPRELPRQAVRLSNDARVEDENDETSVWQMDNDIVIVLGDKVKFKGFGLDARFTGDVRIKDQPQLPLSLTGNVSIQEGRYKAYGQNLRVERGNLFFQGQADNPGLDILAVRNLQSSNSTVGLEIGGTLLYPQSRVFSQPVVEETEAMALLLTGRPLSNASERDGNAILQAIAVYGINQGDFISERVGKSLGIEVGFDSEGENDKTAFMLGKQLSSKLFVAYSVGIFEAISTVMLRYSLSQDFSLETRTNAQAESIDVLYRTERE